MTIILIYSILLYYFTQNYYNTQVNIGSKADICKERRKHEGSCIYSDVVVYADKIFARMLEVFRYNSIRRDRVVNSIMHDKGKSER